LPGRVRRAPTARRARAPAANARPNVAAVAKLAAVVVSVRIARACLEAARIVKAVWAAPANVLQNVVKIRIVGHVIHASIVRAKDRLVVMSLQKNKEIDLKMRFQI